MGGGILGQGVGRAGGRNGGHRGRGRGCDAGDHRRLRVHAADAHVEAVILAVVALDLKLRQVVVSQQFRQGLDEGHIGFMGVFAHAVLAGFVPGP